MKEIVLTQGKVALVSDEDFDELSKYTWYAHKDGKTGTFYVRRRCASGTDRRTGMCHQILGVTSSTMVDHKDGDGLNEQRDNIRVCTKQQNLMNQCANGNKTSRFKGVTMYPTCTKHPWNAHIKVDGKWINLGYHVTEEAAALAYNKAATELFGEFARPNVI